MLPGIVDHQAFCHSIGSASPVEGKKHATEIPSCPFLISSEYPHLILHTYIKLTFQKKTKFWGQKPKEIKSSACAMDIEGSNEIMLH